jgi:hypothetical protein
MTLDVPPNLLPAATQRRDEATPRAEVMPTKLWRLSSSCRETWIALFPLRCNPPSAPLRTSPESKLPCARDPAAGAPLRLRSSPQGREPGAARRAQPSPTPRHSPTSRSPGTPSPAPSLGPGDGRLRWLGVGSWWGETRPAAGRVFGFLDFLGIADTSKQRVTDPQGLLLGAPQAFAGSASYAVVFCAASRRFSCFSMALPILKS